MFVVYIFYILLFILLKKTNNKYKFFIMEHTKNLLIYKILKNIDDLK